MGSVGPVRLLGTLQSRSSVRPQSTHHRVLTMKLLLAISALLSPSFAFLFNANMHIQENGTYYNQTESFDPVTEDVITIIPGHHRNGIFLHDVIKIENERLGLLVWRMKEDDVCHLEHLLDTDQPSRLLLLVASMETNNVTVDTSNIFTEYFHSVDDGEWEGDRDTLTQDMKLLCEGRDIRKIKNTFITEEQFQDLVNGQNREDDRMMAPTGRARCGTFCCRPMAILRSSGEE